MAELRACFRFQIESYNGQCIVFIGASKEIEYSSSSWLYFIENLGWNTGTQVDGIQSAYSAVKKNIPGGGFGGG